MKLNAIRTGSYSPMRPYRGASNGQPHTRSITTKTGSLSPSTLPSISFCGSKLKQTALFLALSSGLASGAWALRPSNPRHSMSSPEAIIPPIQAGNGYRWLKPTATMPLVNQQRGPIKTVLMGIDDRAKSQDGLHPLQIEFLKALHTQNPNATILLTYGKHTTPERLMELETTLFKTLKIPRKTVRLLPSEGNVTWYQQDNLMALNLKTPSGNQRMALEPKGGYRHSSHVASDLVKARIGFDEKQHSTLYFEGGDIRPIHTPYGPGLLIGYRSLEHQAIWMNQAPTPLPQRIVQTVSEFINTFSTLGYSPRSLVFIGGNTQKLTFGDVLKTMPPEERRRLHPHIETLKESELPMHGLDYHADLVGFTPGCAGPSGKPVMVLSRPVPPLNLTSAKTDLARERYEKSLVYYNGARKQLLDGGFEIETVPSSTLWLTPDGKSSLLNYVNIVTDQTDTGQPILYIGVQGGNSPQDKEALETYRKLYGPQAILIPVPGMLELEDGDGLLNCMVNVIERLPEKERPES